jgi:hypothetical protein
LTVEKTVDESEAEVMEESLFQLPPTVSSKPKPFALDVKEKWQQQKDGSSRPVS